MKAPEQIQTTRLLIRRPRMSDAVSIFERYAGDPEVMPYLGWPMHRRVEDTEAFLRLSDSEWQRWPAGPFLVFPKEDGQLLGGTGLTFESPNLASTGYVFARDAWGNGFATEALGAMVELAEMLGVETLYALCHPDHRASYRVMEKCGFELDARLEKHTEFPNLEPGVRSDVLKYAIKLPAHRDGNTG